MQVGFQVLDCLASKAGVRLTSAKDKAFQARAVIAGQQVVLAKPITFMNLSGEAVGKLTRYYKVCLVAWASCSSMPVLQYTDIDIAPVTHLRVFATRKVTALVIEQIDTLGELQLGFFTCSYLCFMFYMKLLNGFAKRALRGSRKVKDVQRSIQISL